MTRFRPKFWQIGIFAALVCGVLLRLIWPTDIEFKYDEWYMYDQTQKVGITEPLPWLGMPSGVQTRNPGLSVWVFVGLARLFGAKTPVELTQAVMIVNSIALFFMLFFVFKWVKKDDLKEKEPWLWATAIASVNPHAILFQRKIWTCSIFPIFTLGFLAGFWNRQKKWGAFVWGLIGACLGQIHMPGFFFAFGFFAWVVIFARKSVNWVFWLIGSVMGALPMIPWLQYLFSTPGARAEGGEPLFSKAFWKIWVTDPLGIDLKYSLRGHFSEFKQYPLFGDGSATNLVEVLQGVLVAIGLIIALRALVFLLLDFRNILSRLKCQEPSALLQNAVFFGFGISIMLSRFYLHRHYLLVAIPIQFIWFSRLSFVTAPQLSPVWRNENLRLTRALLLVLCVSQFLMSFNFLNYIRIKGGAPQGDFGVSYRARSEKTSLSTSP